MSFSVDAARIHATNRPLTGDRGALGWIGLEKKDLRRARVLDIGIGGGGFF